MKFHEKSLTQACDFFLKTTFFWKNWHAWVRIFSWNSMLSFMRVSAHKKALKNVFLPRFWVHVFSQIWVLIYRQNTSEKNKSKFHENSLTQACDFFQKTAFSKTRLNVIYKVVIKKHPYFTLFRTLDLENILGRCDE